MRLDCKGGGQWWRAHRSTRTREVGDDDERPPNCGRRKSVGLSLQWCKEQVFVVHKMLKESSSSNSSAPKVASSLLFSLFFDLVVFGE